MSPSEQPPTEQQRIEAVYRDWLGRKRIAAYAWHRPDVMAQTAARNRVAGTMLASTIGMDLGQLKAIDVGCGSGGFLRQLIDWGANPALLVGTEYQPARLDQARRCTAPGVRWHLGDLDIAATGSVNLVVANTVFSSILAPATRQALADDMWRVLAPGGWCLIFDFRYNNPANEQVRRVNLAELRAWWPGRQTRYQTLLLAPPLARRLVWAPVLVTELLAALLPPLRSHFMYMVQKPH